VIELPDWARATPEGRAWLERLPRLVEECADEWGLTLGEPFPLAAASLALAVTTPDAEGAVLKICFPHRESEHEADALRVWDGIGAVRLIAHDRERWALLIERCLPGTQLANQPAGEGLDVLISLLPRLWVSATEPFRSLADEAAWWASYLPERWRLAGRPFERNLLDAACDALRDLPPTQGEQVLLHQDLHPGNVLSAEREPWLVIDPKPLAGEREFALAPIVRAFELGHSERGVRHRLDRLTEALGLDRERARLWALGQTIAWCFDSEYRPDHVDTARWLLAA
jgi:streptomycin 6-kinase